MSIKKDVISFANAIGIEYIGFCDAHFNQKFVERLNYSYNKGYNCEFQEKNVEKRLNVQEFMEDARTFISIALPYKTVEIDKSKPYLSKSSLGLDYHNVLKNKLRIIEDFLQEKYYAKTLSFVDTSPLHDREIAYMCGIGFYGKNSTIITEKYGSYIFLGEILTNIYIEPDTPKESMCGKCNKCILSCPAYAIEEDYFVNSNKCLSYITQKKSDLSEYEQNKIGLRIYGCDTCQDVCPFNINAQKSNIIDFLPFDWNININVEDFINMSNKNSMKHLKKLLQDGEVKEYFKEI